MNQIINTNTGEQLNFFDLFRKKNYIIEIPIIQRDYAQGRINKIKIRNTFIDALYYHLKENKNVDLDFVYGSVIGQTSGIAKFVPLDGQQRLTTLFLLHWYLANKDGRVDQFQEHLLLDDKSRFTYETRTSSREFCNSLVKFNLNLSELLPSDENENNSLSKTIRNTSWYFLFWDNDPSVKGMLTMLDTIHNKFKLETNFYDKLVNDVNPIITFQFLNLPLLKMTDDLYIKMNARGKALTDYENFKAQFEKFLEAKHPQFKKEFSDKIDGQWCDLFWDYSVNNSQKATYTIDQRILRFFSYISEMLFYKQSQDDTSDFDFNNFKIIEQVFENESNLIFLIKSFDLFSVKSSLNFRTEIDVFFTTLFSKVYEDKKVALFENNINLFEKLINNTGGIDSKEKLILFSVINYMINSNHTNLIITDNFRFYIRICRNYILKFIQKGNRTQKDIYVPELRTSSFPDIIATLITIYESDHIYEKLHEKLDNIKLKRNFQDEIFKANLIANNKELLECIHQLEDHQYLKGNLHNFEDLIKDKDDLVELTIHFYQIFGELTDGLISRSLLAVDDYSIKIGDCYFGSLWLFGKKDNWNRILTDKENSEKLKPIFKKYFDYLKNSQESDIKDKLKSIIKHGISKNDQPEWINLLLKHNKAMISKKGIFSFRNDTDFTIDKLDGTSLQSAHINCFVDAVINSNKITTKVSKDCKARDIEETFIILKKGMYMYVDDKRWYINAKSTDVSDLVQKFKLEQIDDKKEYYLDPTEDKDFVEVAIEFINKVYE
ncbi:DUF262 domain-containing protein [Flavobacterium sp. N2270]|uniref:DUF262 domain-containing protein n=1 Tax=Flavobacterium sp. N2270 TaxID=2986831 RepID=UPI002224B322|nr:DUF262 domain-containing protein [Flavobacterium sp. N2270]